MSKKFLFFILSIQYISFTHPEESPLLKRDATPVIHCQLYFKGSTPVHKGGNIPLPKRFDLPKRFIPIPGAVIRYGSKQLNSCVDDFILPMIFNATTKNHYYAIPGYGSPDGLRSYFIDSSKFPYSDAEIIDHLNRRLESYFTRIENIIFNTKGMFQEIISHETQTQLAKICAEFLKEFYSDFAPAMFEEWMNAAPTLQSAMRALSWDDCTCENQWSYEKRVRQIYASSLNGNLGVVYKELQAGNNEKAFAVGCEQVTIANPGHTLDGKKKTTSVFQEYPKLHQVVEQRCNEDKAKVAQELAKKKLSIQQQSVYLLHEYTTYYDYPEWQPYQTILDKRIDAAKCDVTSITLQKKIHSVPSIISPLIDMSYLTADQKSILFDGSRLQHTLVDEVVDIIDSIFAQHCKEKLEENAIKYAQQSLYFNQKGDVITASHKLDACWMFFDFIKKVAHCGYDLVASGTLFIAAAQGVQESLSANAHMLLHPIETAYEIISACATVAYYMGISVCKLLECKGLPNLITGCAEVDCIADVKSLEPSIFDMLGEQIKGLSAEDVTRIIARLVTDWVLMNQIVKVASSVTKITKEVMPHLANCLRKGSTIMCEGTQAAKVAITAEGATAKCAEEISLLMENVNKTVGGAAGNAIASEGSQVAKAAVTAESIIAAEETLVIKNARKASGAKDLTPKLKNVHKANKTVLGKGAQKGAALKTSNSIAIDTRTGNIIKELPRAKERLFQTISNFSNEKLYVGNVTCLLDKKGLRHILERHHPKFWDGTVAKGAQTFFDENISVSEIVRIIKKVVKQNRSIITYENMNGKLQIFGVVDSIKYTVGFYYGRIGQCFPSSK